MSKPKQPLRSRTSRSVRASERMGLVLLAALLLVVGCATGSGDAPNGMRAWVDERGQIRYSAAPAANPGQTDDGSGSSESAEERQAEADDPTHPIFNLRNFPDAGDQAQETEHLFYSWRDAQGRVFNTPYRYEEESMGRVMRDPESERASVARVTVSGAVEAPGFRRDSRAASVLGLGKDSRNRLDAVADHCCGGLPRLDYYKLKPERSVSVRLDGEAAVHRFVSGESRFALARLPEDATRSLLRVRSFIRRRGFFVPNAVFLDGRFQPVRLVTDLVLEYNPETWRRYGSMEARLALRPDSGERWVVLFTRPADLEASTEVGGEGRRTRLTHSPEGSLALRLVE